MAGILAEWCEIFENIRTFADDEVFSDIFRKAELAAMSPEKRDQYIADMISERDYENILRTAQHIGQREGYAEGVAEGLEKGRAAGREEGKSEGRHLERLAIAKAMLVNGISAELVSASTGLSIDEVRGLSE